MRRKIRTRGQQSPSSLVNQYPFDTSSLRQAVGAFVTGVTVVTTRSAQGLDVGVTANSFNSVSLEPPLVLWSLSRHSRSMPAFKESELFAVHILRDSQQDLSQRFASRSEDKFAGLPLERGLNGLPLLPGCLTRLQCRTQFRYEGGDHVILVGEVLTLEDHEGQPLVYHRGGYVHLMNPAPAPA